MTKPKDPSLLKGKASKLKGEDVRRIRDVYAKGLQSVREMAQFYGVGAETIRRAIRGETWNDLHMSPPKTEEELEAEASASYEKLLQGIAAEKERKTAGDKMVQELAEAPFDPADPYAWVRRK